MKLFYIAVALILVMLIAGCISDKLPGMPEKAVSIFSSGKGIETNIALPADKMVLPLNYAFSPRIIIENNGGAETDGEVCIAGLKSEGECECRDFDISLDPESENYLETEVQFNSYEPTSTGDFILVAITRYNYKTEAEAMACIRAEPFEEGDCEIKVGKEEGVGILQSVSGGPIKITNVKESMLPIDDTTATLLFTVYVKDVSAEPSQLIKEEDVYSGKCKGLAYEEGDEPEIRIELEDLLYSEYVDCGTIKLDKKGEGSIVCKVENYGLVNADNEYLFEGKEEIAFEIIASYSFEMREGAGFSVK
ncbi:hypothetical protein HZB88_01530 [archaeon]|nr:hypothetical protein [archaeon]